MHQLRDPAIFEEDGRVYLLYTVAGERRIGLAEVHLEPSGPKLQFTSWSSAAWAHRYVEREPDSMTSVDYIDRTD